MSEKRRLGRWIVWASLLGLVPAMSALAQNAEPRPSRGTEIVRDAAELEFEIQVVDRSVANTALVFTNSGREPARVLCTAFGGNGRRIGKVWLRIPGRGLRFALASDLSNGGRFVGSARCVAPSRVLGSAVFVGPSLGTDLSVQQALGTNSIFFPLVATF